MTSVVLSTPDAGLPSLSRSTRKKVRGSTPPPAMKPEDVPWRGHGGRAPTMSSVEFDRQLDKVSVWLEDWTHEQRCLIVEGVLNRSNYNQIQFLFTTLQPVLHRDFMYTAKTQFPNIQFLPISTHTSRKLKEKLIYTRQDNYHRISSAHYRNDDEVKQQVTQGAIIRLPDIQNATPREKPDKTGTQFSILSPHKKTKWSNHVEGNVKTSLEKWVGDGSNPLYASLPHIRPLRYIEMPIRRHIQDESSARQNIVAKSATSNITGASMFDGKSNTSNGMNMVAHSDGAITTSPRRTKASNKNKVVTKPGDVVLPEESHLLYRWYTQDWPDVKRNEFLHKFLLKLDPRQHYFITSLLAARHCKDFISLLPNHIALKILNYLTVHDLLRCCMVCKSWNKLANTNQLWQTKCESVKLEVPVLVEEPPWKQLYRENKFLRPNWNEGKCKMTDLKGHSDTVNCVIFNHDRLASGSLDKTIRVWNMKTGKCIQVLKGHVKGVWCLNFFTQYLLISGSYDGTVRVWNLRTNKCQKTIIAHEGPIWAMVRHEDTLVTASQDKTAKIWDINRCLLKNSLIGHTAAIFAIDMNEDGKLVITGSADKSVKIWNKETGRCLRWISVSQTTSIMSVSFSKGYVACSYGETICLYRVEGPTKLIRKFNNIVNEHNKRIECLELDISDKDKQEGMIVSAGKDGRVKYWNINNERSIQTFLGHKGEGVNAIHFDELRIASAAQDNKIRIWDFNV